MSDFTRISELGQSSRTQEPSNIEMKQNEPSKNVTMPNYSDLLSSMKSEMNQNQQPPKQNTPPAQPHLEQVNQQLLENQQILGQNIQHEFHRQNQQLDELREAQKEKSKPLTQPIPDEMELKFEAFGLACICALIQMPNLQQILFSKVPSMYDNLKLTIIGVLLNSILISVSYIVFRKLALKYMKGC